MSAENGGLERKLSAREMRECIEYDRKPGIISYHEHWHDFYEWIFYYGVEATGYLNSVPHKIRGGTTILLSPYDFHRTEVISAAPDAFYVRITFSGEGIPADAPQCGYYLEQTDDFLEKLRQCFEESDTEERFFLLSAMLRRLKTCGVPISAGGNGSFACVREALAYLYEHPEASLSETARVCHVSEGYLSNTVHRQCGSTFREISVSVRINRARSLLLNTDRKITEIAMLSGYGNFSHFLRVFRKTVGCTPKEFRNKSKKGQKP